MNPIPKYQIPGMTHEEVVILKHCNPNKFMYLMDPVGYPEYANSQPYYGYPEKGSAIEALILNLFDHASRNMDAE